MANLSSILSISRGSLQAMQGALDITSNNIANSNTAGYTREVVNLTAQPGSSGSDSGGGVALEGYTSVRDSVLQSQIYDQTQAASYSDTQSSALQQAEVIFSSSTSGLGSDITAFFNNVSALSTDPSSSALRQSVLSSASTIVSDFHSAASTLSSIKNGLNQSVPPSVNEINQLSKQLATLNAQITQASISGHGTGTLEDQRDQLISQLAKLTDLQTSKADDSISVSIGNGTPLVIGDKAFELGTSVGADGNYAVTFQDSDITSTLTGGSLGATFLVRDTTLPAITTKLDDLASQFSDAVNSANQSGYDLNGGAGGDIFSSSGGTGAATDLALAITSGDAIAASSDASSGSNGNIANLLAVQTDELTSGMTPIEAFSDIVYTVGNAASLASDNSTAATSALTQLQTRQASISGVSLDEETTNMIQYQHSYQAAAKMISTVSTIYDSLLSMGA